MCILSSFVQRFHCNESETYMQVDTCQRSTSMQIDATFPVLRVPNGRQTAAWNGIPQQMRGPMNSCDDSSTRCGITANRFESLADMALQTVLTFSNTLLQDRNSCQTFTCKMQAADLLAAKRSVPSWYSKSRTIGKPLSKLCVIYWGLMASRARSSVGMPHQNRWWTCFSPIPTSRTQPHIQASNFRVEPCVRIGLVILV